VEVRDKGGDSESFTGYGFPSSPRGSNERKERRETRGKRIEGKIINFFERRKEEAP
jgi:hypothetical protein